MKKHSLGAVLGVLLVAVSARAEIGEVTVTGGRVSGVSANGVTSFKGIPFAAPPVGELRWKAPQPLKAWTGVRDGSKFGAACMQDANFARVFNAPPEFSEDCLSLNVWTPAKSASEALPVMVWIYGGGFVGGQTSVPAYDGAHLARKGVVLVSVAYRLGVFGFMAHPELSRESGKGSGNYGLQDQIAGLRWVKNNIAKFGGNPNRVTIFGESAGGLSVSMLAASPAAKGLFQGVISESGGSFGGPKFANEGGMTVAPLSVAEANGRRFLEKLGANDIKTARAIAADKLQAALGPGLQATFWPVFDADVLPSDQYELYQAKRFNDTPILVGTNSDEGGLFVQGSTTPARFEQFVRDGFGKGADAILAAYPHATEAEAFKASKDLMRESTFAWHTWAWARLQSEKGKSKAYVYYYDHRTPQQPNGAGHGSEIGYVFGTIAAMPSLGPIPAGAPRPEDL
ncbi:MAG TPA: carboxylesterase family protein, partial [Vicinamibacterales bacterium]|nr:carboxylesterase family protein [Vicinamibacterales bacterium]